MAPLSRPVKPREQLHEIGIMAYIEEEEGSCKYVFSFCPVLFFLNISDDLDLFLKGVRSVTVEKEFEIPTEKGKKLNELFVSRQIAQMDRKISSSSQKLSSTLFGRSNWSRFDIYNYTDTVV